MKHQVYQVTLESSMGPRRGTLTLTEEAGTLCGDFSILGTRNDFSGGRREADLLCFSCTLQTKTGCVVCRMQLHAQGNTLQGTVYTARGNMFLTGTRCTDLIPPHPEGGTSK